MSTSRKEVLELLAKGKITADEAANLLSQVTAEEVATPSKAAVLDPVSKPVGSGSKPSWLHVRVRDLQSGRNKVTVNIPLGIVKFGLKVGGRFTPELNGLDWNELQGMMNEMESGILVDVEDEEDGEHVQIYVD
jgi:hypothetical protein